MSGMKKMRLISAVLGIGKKVLPFCLFTFLPLSLMAQDDDMYFVPSKENVAKEAKTYGMPRNTYYSGSQRSVDEYNRRGMSSLTPIDSAGNDIIDFSAVRGVYPDSTYTDQADNDYQLTRKMSRFDDYTPSEAYWDGYRDGRWSSPWYHTSGTLPRHTLLRPMVLGYMVLGPSMALEQSMVLEQSLVLGLQQILGRPVVRRTALAWRRTSLYRSSYQSQAETQWQQLWRIS